MFCFFARATKSCDVLAGTSRPTTITIALDQTEYNLPAVANLDLLEVWIQTDTTDETDDNQWVKLYNWRIHYSATGTADTVTVSSGARDRTTL